MKKDTHPEYHQVEFKCACGASFSAGSTIKDDTFSTEICSKCHPFYTGQQKLVDSSGRVEKFKAKMAKAKKETKETRKEEPAAEAPEKAPKETEEKAA